MNILFLCNKSPWPPKEGGSMAMNQLIEGLANQGHRIKVLAVNSEKFFVKQEQVPKEYLKKTDIEWIDVDLSFKPLSAFLNLFSKKSYHVSRFVSSQFQNRLTEVLKQESFDVIQLETLFMTPYISLIRKNCTAKIVLRTHNIEHLIWQRIYKQSRNPFKKFYLRHLFSTLRNYELNVIYQPDGLIPITEKDAVFFKRHTHKPVQTIPFGMSVSDKNPENSENALYHIGAMNWIPNVEGIRWFLNKVWPILTKQHPDLRLYLAGREMPEWMIRLKQNNVKIVGEVEDAAAFVQSKSIGIAPLFSGSGIRIKIIESMRLGKAVVSTTIGAEGIDVQNGKNILLADTPKDFAQAISYLYTHTEEAAKMGKSAQEHIKENHNPDEIIKQLTGFYRQIL
ncbi:MAG: glycosyltransferase [Bacteroidales bacterium]|nr:glycosyltransferase [Bacteroidales bacterium]